MHSIKIAGIVAVVLLAMGIIAIVRTGRTQPVDGTTYGPENMKDFKKPEPAELKKKAVLRAIRGHATMRHGTAVPQRLLGQS